MEKSHLDIEFDDKGDFLDDSLKSFAEHDKKFKKTKLSKAWARKRKRRKDPEHVVTDLIEIREAVRSLLKVHGLPYNTPIDLALLGKTLGGLSGYHDVGVWKKPFIILSTDIYDKADPDDLLDIYCGIGLHEADHILNSRKIYLRMKNKELKPYSRRWVWENLVEDERIEALGRERSPGFAPYYHALKRFYFEKGLFGESLEKWDELADVDKILTIIFGFLRCPYLLRKKHKEWKTVKGTCVFNEVRALFPKLIETEDEVEDVGKKLIVLWENLKDEYVSMIEKTTEEVADEIEKTYERSTDEKGDSDIEEEETGDVSGDATGERRGEDDTDTSGDEGVGSEETDDHRGGEGTHSGGTTSEGKDVTEHKKSEQGLDEEKDKESEKEIEDENEDFTDGTLDESDSEYSEHSDPNDEGGEAEIDGTDKTDMGESIQETGKEIEDEVDKSSGSRDTKDREITDKDTETVRSLTDEPAGESHSEKDFSTGEGIEKIEIPEEYEDIPDDMLRLPDGTLPERPTRKKLEEKIARHQEEMKKILKEDEADAKAIRDLRDIISSELEEVRHMTESVESVSEMTKEKSGEEFVREHAKKIKDNEDKIEEILEKRKKKGRFGYIEVEEIIRKMSEVSAPLDIDESVEMAKAEHERLEVGEKWKWGSYGSESRLERRIVVTHPIPNSENKARYLWAKGIVQNYIDRMKSVFRMRLGKRLHVMTELKEGKLHRKQLAMAPITDRIYTQTKEVTAKGLRLYIVLDESGSMWVAGPISKNSKASRALQIAVLIVESLKHTPGVEVDVFSFSSTGAGHTDCLIKYLYGAKNKNIESIGGYHGEAENYDHVAIQYVTKQIIENRKNSRGKFSKEVMIIISDGAPSGADYGGPSAISATKKAIDDAERKGIYVLGIAIEPYAIERMYKHWLKLTDLNQLISDMRKIITQMIKAVS